MSELRRPPGSLDVAAAIIEAPIYVDQLKLQKLLYFARRSAGT